MNAVKLRRQLRKRGNALEWEASWKAFWAPCSGGSGGWGRVQQAQALLQEQHVGFLPDLPEGLYLKLFLDLEPPPPSSPKRRHRFCTAVTPPQ